jgi:small-conductance mechanosensitive channel
MIGLLEAHPWAATLAGALLAVFGAILVHRLGRVLLPRVFRHGERVQPLLRHIDRPAGAVLPLLALLLVWQFAPDHLRFILALRQLTVLLVIAALTWLALGVIRGLAEALVASHPVRMEDNLQARRIQTQIRVLSRTAMIVVLIAGGAMALMTIPGARQVGASLLASAGVVGIVGGIAARPVFSNLIAGLQLALAQPIRIDDVLIVKGEFGRVEEITGTYVVLKLWDERRLIVPLQWFIENPFENWTRSSAQIVGKVMLYVDYATPVEAVRAEARRIVEAAPEWDRRVFNVMVTDTNDRAMELRVLVSAANAGKAFDLQCRVREELLAFLARAYPECLPLVRSPAPSEAHRDPALLEPETA